MKKRTRTPVLNGLYHQYLADQNTVEFGAKVAARYGAGTLERLAQLGDRMVRRAAVLALGILGDFRSNKAMGRALHDDDRGVRMLAESGIRDLWLRVDTKSHCQQLAAIVDLNAEHRYPAAIHQASQLIEQAPTLAEAWHLRASAHYATGRFADAAHDGSRALDLNAYHFAAASLMAQAKLQLGHRALALECFRRALAINPNLEGVRAQVLYLQRSLKSPE